MMISLVEKDLFESSVWDFKIRDLIESIAPPFERAMSSSLDLEEKKIWSTIHTDESGERLFFLSRPNFALKTQFCNYVSCELFVEDFKLVLETYTFWFFDSDKQRDLYKTVVAEGVQKIAFEFYLPGENVNEGGKIVDKITEGSFQFPRMIKLSVYKQDGSIKNMFFNVYSNPFLIRVD